MIPGFSKAKGHELFPIPLIEIQLAGSRWNKIQDIKIRLMIQKKIHYILIAFFDFLCDTNEENSLDFVENINAPSNVDFVIDISEDNLGIVKITPFGDGLLNSTVDFGDDSELSEEITPGESVIHDYDDEGTYDITINAKGVNGKVTEFTKSVDVLYLAPSVPVRLQ